MGVRQFKKPPQVDDQLQQCSSINTNSFSGFNIPKNQSTQNDILDSAKSEDLIDQKIKNEQSEHISCSAQSVKETSKKEK